MAEPPNRFLDGLQLRSIALPVGCPFTILGLAIGKGATPLEVLAAESSVEPNLPQVRAVWKARQGGRAAPLILVVLHDGKATLCGPSGDEPATYSGVERGQAERLCREALEKPDRHAALRWLRDALPSMDSRLPGLRNEGFLATHALEAIRRIERHRELWSESTARARPLLQAQGDALIRSLGFKAEALNQVTSILRAGANAKKVAVAVLLRQEESPELSTPRFTDMSPVSYALAVADRENIPYVLISQGSKLRLYPAKVGVGVGRRGRTETYVEVHTGLLRDSDAAFLWLLFSAEALTEGGSLSTLMEESDRFAGDLAERLRERIYVEVIPPLAEGLAKARGLQKPAAKDLAETYEMAMMVLFRLLFIAYAEDKDLLPFKFNDRYKARSLKVKAQELLRLQLDQTPFDKSTSYWEEVSLLCRAVDDGKAEWSVPAYDGGLFSRDKDVSPLGALLDKLTLPNTIFGHVLRDLLVIQSPEGWGPVDFRTLNVGEFGTIYQGLLESELAIAETDLTVDEKGFYRPCRAGEKVEVKESRIYLHNRSGARKATGTYFTKDFAVAHLLDQALEPALTDHCRRLDAFDDETAADAFFDFRVADISMGSAHFLVAAVDRIERALTGYIAKRPLPGVRGELLKLRAAAEQGLGPLAEAVEIEDTQLLRRLIARRCIYGVDLNPVAVDLARLSLWIHTFVPGLPLSLLDRNLVVGNSLVGIGQLSEIKDQVRRQLGDTGSDGSEGELKLYDVDAERLLGETIEPLKRLAKIADASTSEIASARRAAEEARNAAKPAEALCDIVAAVRMSGAKLEVDLPHWETVKRTIVGSRPHREAGKTLANLNVFHFPVAFPEVFLRARKGFDVIVGNPPWEEATLEEHAFWARHSPGLRAVTQREREGRIAKLRRLRPDLTEFYEKELAGADATRKALVTGPYPGMGTGDPDLYKAFCWRFLNLVGRDGGCIGVVLPRSAFNAKGSTDFRKVVFESSNPLDVTMLLNNCKWVFPEVHPQYTIGLVALRCGVPEGESVHLRGPFASLDRFRAGASKPPAKFAASEVTSWTDSASLPLLPTEESLEIFTQLRKSPRLGLNDGESWRARPHRELDATNDKELMDLKSADKPPGFWPVFKGESFDIWQPDTGRYYAWADPEIVLPELQSTRLRGAGNRKSPFSEFSRDFLRKAETLPPNFARIAFRDVSRATDSRTIRAALLPPKVFLTNKGPYLLWPRSDERDQAYLLGVLCSLPLDWYARRFIENAVNFFIFNPLPVPRPPRDSKLWQRVVSLAGRLAAVDNRFGNWAKAVGVDCGPLEANTKAHHIHELDAVVAHLYGLTEPQLVHIFETFHEGWAYADRLEATLKHFHAWAKELTSLK